MNIETRCEVPADIGSIESLIAAAFRDAPHASGTEQLIVDALRKAGRLTLSLVAEDAGGVVGHVAVSPVSMSDSRAGWHGLGPISVLPGRQGQGIGTLLMERALAGLQELGAAGCVVLGDPAYYGRFGFRAESGLVLPGVPPQYFQEIAFRGPVPTGTVAYHEAFDTRG